MKKHQQKGAALIVAVMIVLILSIITLGFIQITSWSSEQANKSYRDMKIFWAAESGANHAIRWIKRLKAENFGSPKIAFQTKDYFNGNVGINSFKLYENESTSKQITVNITLNFDTLKSQWSITSHAVQGNGEDATVTVSVIKAINPAKYSYGLVTNQMYGGFRYRNGDTFDGEFYSSGGLNFNCAKVAGRRPHFNKKVSISKSSWNNSTLSKGLPTQSWWANSSGNYKNGLYANNLDQYPSVETNGTDGFVEVMKDIFKGPIEMVDPINPDIGVSYSWDELGNTDAKPIEGLKPYKIGSMETSPGVIPTNGIFNEAGEKVKIVFSFDATTKKTSAKVYGTTTAGVTTLKETITIGTGTGEYNTILVPNCPSSVPANGNPSTAGFSYVEVNGTVGADACVATEFNTVIISDDIKYSNLNYPTPISYPSTPIDIQAQINAAPTTTPKFSILAGLTCPTAVNNTDPRNGWIWAQPPSGKSNLIITGSLFTPKGRYGSNSNATFKTINIGSVLTYDKASYHGTDGGGDMTANFYDDERYSNSIFKPLGYINAIGIGFLNEQINILMEGYNWEVTY